MAERGRRRILIERFQSRLHYSSARVRLLLIILASPGGWERTACMDRASHVRPFVDVIIKTMFDICCLARTCVCVFWKLAHLHFQQPVEQHFHVNISKYTFRIDAIGQRVASPTPAMPCLRCGFMINDKEAARTENTVRRLECNTCGDARSHGMQRTPKYGHTHTPSNAGMRQRRDNDDGGFA